MKINRNIPITDILIVVGVLGYFICPHDLIPDWIPAVGFIDDAAAIATVLRIVSKHVTLETEKAAERKLGQIFKNVDSKEIARIVAGARRKKKKR